MSLYSVTGHTKVKEDPNPNFHAGQTVTVRNMYGEEEKYNARIVTRYVTEVIDREAEYYNKNMQYLVERSGRLHTVFPHQIVSY